MALSNMKNQLNSYLGCWWICLMIITGMLTCLAQADDHYYDFVLRESNFTRLCDTGSLLAVNESIPGPEIRVHKGDTLYVNVYNYGNYGVTIHWHGVKQPRNPWFDGPEFITQCPIPPGTNFTYQVLFSDEEGTLWWHAHSDWTRVTVHGAIAILPAEGSSYPYPAPDGEQTIIIGEWYLGDLYEEIIAILADGDDTPESASFTINGQPGDLSQCSNETTFRMEVDYGNTYLLRIVNAAINAVMFFAIAGHNMTVVGMDGSYLKPLTTGYIMIPTGQTMDVLFTANNSLGYYYMVTRQFYTPKADVATYDKTNTTAIIQYRGNYTVPTYPIFPKTLPAFQDFTAAKAFTGRLRSLASAEHPVNVPKNVSTRMVVTTSMTQYPCPNASCEGIDGNRLRSSLNNMSFVNPTTDILQAYYRNLSGLYDSDFPNNPPTIYNFTGIGIDNISFTNMGTKVKVVNYMESVELVFQGTNSLNASETHPMHLHGHTFYMVGSGLGNFNVTTDPDTYNLVDPPEVNTAIVPKLGWAAIRFIANNPGVWFIHCHFDRHMSWGMDSALIVKDGGTPETSIRPPPDYLPPCSNWSTTHLKAFNISIAYGRDSSM